MELILFIILGGYLLIRCGTEKAESKMLDRHRQDWEERRKEWVESVTDRELEAGLKFFIERPENRNLVLEEVADVYDSILNGRRIDEFYPKSLWCKCGKGWTPVFHEHVQELICRQDSENALRIMMAKRGHLTWLDAFDGSFKSIQTASKLTAKVIEWCAHELNGKQITEPFVIPDIGIYGATGGIGWEIK